MSLPHEKRSGFQVSRSNRYVIRVVFATVIMTLAILAILPFTQALSGDPRQKDFREVSTANIPPPEPPPPEPPPPPEEEEPEVDEYEEPPPQLELSQLEASLNPGVGNALSPSLDFSRFSTRAGVVDEMKIFSIRELDEKPGRTKTIMPTYPIDVRRDKIEGIVRARIQIDENGDVTIMEIVNSPDPRLSEATREALEQWTFEPPLKDGKKVKAQYIQPIPFTL